MIRRNSALFLIAISCGLVFNIYCSSNEKKPNSIKIELIGNKIYAERAIFIDRASTVSASIVKDSIYISPSITKVEDVVFNTYFECFNSFFTSLDTTETDYRGVKIVFLYDDNKSVEKSFYGKNNVDFIINKLETSAAAKYDSIGANVINVIKKNRNFYYH